MYWEYTAKSAYEMNFTLKSCRSFFRIFLASHWQCVGWGQSGSGPGPALHWLLKNGQLICNLRVWTSGHSTTWYFLIFECQTCELKSQIKKLKLVIQSCDVYDTHLGLGTLSFQFESKWWIFPTHGITGSWPLGIPMVILSQFITCLVYYQLKLK